MIRGHAAARTPSQQSFSWPSVVLTTAVACVLCLLLSVAAAPAWAAPSIGGVAETATGAVADAGSTISPSGGGAGGGEPAAASETRAASEPSAADNTGSSPPSRSAGPAGDSLPSTGGLADSRAASDATRGAADSIPNLPASITPEPPSDSTDGTTPTVTDQLPNLTAEPLPGLGGDGASGPSVADVADGATVDQVTSQLPGSGPSGPGGADLQLGLGDLDPTGTVPSTDPIELAGQVGSGGPASGAILPGGSGSGPAPPTTFSSAGSVAADLPRSGDGGSPGPPNAGPPSAEPTSSGPSSAGPSSPGAGPPAGLSTAVGEPSALVQAIQALPAGSHDRPGGGTLGGGLDPATAAVLALGGFPSSAGPAAPASPRPEPVPGAPGGAIGSAGVSSSGLFFMGFATLLMVFSVAFGRFTRRLDAVPASWRPMPFLSLLERPG